MSPLRLFTAFHANLDFSALPDADRPLVIARCYWPLLRLPEELGIPIGFELTARTLRTLLAEDPEWVKRFRGLAERGLVEPIASGWAQVVAPLAPLEVNRANLALGRRAYEEMLGFAPETWYVHEQTFADGLVPLYEEIGARRVVMEWNNPASRRPELRSLRCRPARLAGSQGPGPAVLWNDSIVFQKVQRVAHGEIPYEELEALLARLAGLGGGGALCLYGGDVEIFDYRPSRRLPGGAGGDVHRESERLVALFARLAADPRFELVLPCSLVAPAEQDVLPIVRLTSAADPIPQEAAPLQPHALGRQRARRVRDEHPLSCPRAQRARGTAHRPGRRPESSADGRRRPLAQRLPHARDRGEDRRVRDPDRGRARAQPRAARARRARARRGRGPDHRQPRSRALVGHADRDPAAAAGRSLRGARAPYAAGRPAPALADPGGGRGLHRDGSLREVVLVLAPELPPQGVLGVELVAAPRVRADEAVAAPVRQISTDRVAASFLAHRGAALEALVFPAIDARPVLGTIPHGFFDAIEYTPDFYSGHVVALLEDGSKRTDLRPARLELREGASGAIRTTFVARFESEVGIWQKLYRVYRGCNRLDVVHELAHHDARIASLRLGLFTLLPDGWDAGTLRYGSVNGGATVEWHALSRDTVVAQSKAVSASVSASSCLGATEGWVAIADARHGVLIQGDRGQAAVAPMLDFETVDERFFCRLSHSAAELDETRASFLRGHQRFAFTIEGFRTSDAGVFERARQRHQGLIYRTEAGVGVATGL